MEISHGAASGREAGVGAQLAGGAVALDVAALLGNAQVDLDHLLGGGKLPPTGLAAGASSWPASTETGSPSGRMPKNSRRLTWPARSASMSNCMERHTPRVEAHGAQPGLHQGLVVQVQLLHVVGTHDIPSDQMTR